jgi:hypothetical protein
MISAEISPGIRRMKILNANSEIDIYNLYFFGVGGGGGGGGGVSLKMGCVPAVHPPPT